MMRLVQTIQIMLICPIKIIEKFCSIRPEWQWNKPQQPPEALAALLAEGNPGHVGQQLHPPPFCGALLPPAKQLSPFGGLVPVTLNMHCPVTKAK
jgi:hypothetical protein